MKNKLFLMILSLMLSLPITVWAVDGTALPEQVIQQEQEAAAANSLDEDVVQTDDSTSYKQPVSKRKLIKKFLAAMGGVAVSSIAIFFLLTVYNRVRESYLNQVKTPEGETSLETPTDLNSAVKTFLDKTNW